MGRARGEWSRIGAPLVLPLLSCAQDPTPPCAHGASSASAPPPVATTPAVPATDAALAARHHVDMTVSVADLLARYRTDAAGAEARYKGKRVRVVGGPHDVQADAAGGPLVVLMDRATGTTQNFHYSSDDEKGDAGVPPSPGPFVEALFYREYAPEVSTLTRDKPVVANCTVEGLARDISNVQLAQCSLADLTAYRVCRQMLRFDCLLSGWTEDARVPFLFTGVRWHTGIGEKKVADAWADDGRAPLAAPDFDPEHRLSALERRYADRVIGMFVRADSRTSYERDVEAMKANADAGAGGLGRRHAEDRASRIYVMFPSDAASEDLIEQEQRESTEGHARWVLHRLPQTTD
jgi:hypothetical protein